MGEIGSKFRASLLSALGLGDESRIRRSVPMGKRSHSSPSTFVAAWRRLHNIAQEAGATNLTWVWCPNVSYAGSTSLKALFPGRAYVDWTCVYGYHRGSNPDWHSFSNIFAATYSEILSLTD